MNNMCRKLHPTRSSHTPAVLEGGGQRRAINTSGAQIPQEIFCAIVICTFVTLVQANRGTMHTPTSPRHLLH